MDETTAVAIDYLRLIKPRVALSNWHKAQSHCGRCRVEKVQDTETKKLVETGRRVPRKNHNIWCSECGDVCTHCDGGIINSPMLAEVLSMAGQAVEQYKALEDDKLRQYTARAKDDPLRSQLVKSIPGLNFRTLARIEAVAGGITFETFPRWRNVRSLFGAGADEKGRRLQHRKGQKSRHNPLGQQTLFLLGQGSMNVRKEYYQALKANYIKKENHHPHNSALRRLGQEVLREIYRTVKADGGEREQLCDEPLVQ